MLKKSTFRTFAFLLSLLLIMASVPMFAYIASAEASVVSLPIVIDGSYLEGAMTPVGIDSLPESDQYYHCDNSCGGDFYISNKWYNATDNSPATDFVHGKEYYFQIAIHPKEGYVFPDSFNQDESLQVYGIDWSYVDGYYVEYYNLYFVEFHITYDENEGVPSAPLTEISLPIVIDGSSLAGITSPKGISDLPTSPEYYYCDDSCDSGGWYISNQWYDSNDNVAESFVDGETYYFQIAIHPQDGYKLPSAIEKTNADSERREGIKINGINWERVEGDVYSSANNLYYVMFYITYDAETGVPAFVDKDITLPIDIDGSSLAGITTPAGISDLPISEEYYYCDGYCCENLFISNTWRDVITDEVATSFVNGRRYYYEIAIHPKAGYKLPKDLDIAALYKNLSVSGVEWEDTICGISETYDVYWADFFITYDAESGLPEEIPEIQLPLIIDGSSLAGINEPTGIVDLPYSDSFHYCDNSCNGYFTSNKWYDMTDQEVTSFVEGEEYYYQIAIHPNEGYKLPKYFDMINSIKVEGVEWIGINANVNESFNVYWVDFHIVYHETTEILLGDVNFDGFVNSLDAAQILKHDAFLITLSGDAVTAGDVNKDGELNSLDAALVLKLDADLIDSF